MHNKGLMINSLRGEEATWNSRAAASEREKEGKNKPRERKFVGKLKSAFMENAHQRRKSNKTDWVKWRDFFSFSFFHKNDLVFYSFFQFSDHRLPLSAPRFALPAPETDLHSWRIMCVCRFKRLRRILCPRGRIPFPASYMFLLSSQSFQEKISRPLSAFTRHALFCPQVVRSNSLCLFEKLWITFRID